MQIHMFPEKVDDRQSVPDHRNSSRDSCNELIENLSYLKVNQQNPVKQRWLIVIIAAIQGRRDVIAR